MNEEIETTTDIDEITENETFEEETSIEDTQTIVVYAETVSQIDYTEYLETSINILSSMQTALYVIMACVMLSWVHLITHRRTKK